MSNEVAAVAQPANLYQSQIDKARMLAESTIIPESFRKPSGNLPEEQRAERKREQIGNILVVMEAAEALRISLFQAFQGVTVIKGKMGLYAEMMRALVLRDGHLFIVDELTEQGCRVTVARREAPDREQSFVFTMADAQRAKLTSPDGQYAKYPKSMMLARATTIACKAVFPDVIAGMGSAEELREEAAMDAAPRVVARQITQPAPAVEVVQVPVSLPPGVWMDADGVMHDDATESGDS